MTEESTGGLGRERIFACESVNVSILFFTIWPQGNNIILILYFKTVEKKTNSK